MRCLTDIFLQRNNFDSVLSKCIMNVLRILIIYFLLLGDASSSSVVDLSIDFTALENTGHLRVCNFIVCWGRGMMANFALS